MLRAASWLLDREASVLQDLLQQHSGFSLRFIGHSLGAGTATLAAMLLKVRAGLSDQARVWLCAGRHCWAPAGCRQPLSGRQTVDTLNTPVWLRPAKPLVPSRGQGLAVTACRMCRRRHRG